MSSINTNNNPFRIANMNSRPLVLDGAMGSFLQEKGFNPDDSLWMTKVNKSNPEIILQIHREYIDAGADIITTNTFRTNPSSLETEDNSICKSYVRQAVDLAQEAASNENVFIAGSNAPAEDCYQSFRTLSHKKLEMNHKYHIDLLIDRGVHFILNETQSHLDEIKIICEHCTMNQIPFIISLYVVENSLTILSGQSLEDVLQLIKDSSSLAIGFNCISPFTFVRIREHVDFKFNWGFYLNCGSGNHKDKIITCGVSPNEYIETVKESLMYKPSIIGSCCGSNPKHTKKIKEFLDEQNFS